MKEYYSDYYKYNRIHILQKQREYRQKLNYKLIAYKRKMLLQICNNYNEKNILNEMNHALVPSLKKIDFEILFE